VCGGSGSGHCTAAYLGAKPYLQVNVLTRRPELWSKNITVHSDGTSWESKGSITGKLNKVTTDASEVIPQSDLVIICAPGHAQPDILKTIAPHVRKGVMLGAIFGQGGFDWAAYGAFGGDWSKIDILFCLQNIPWICRTVEYGKTCRFIGPKKNLWVASWPTQRAVDIARIMALLYDIPCATIPNFLTVTLTPSNQIIHPARYYAIFKDWDGKKGYKEDEIEWGLYTGVDDLSAEWLQKLDDDLQAIKHGLSARFPTLDLTSLLPLGDRIVKQYGNDISDKSTLQQIFRTNLGYAGCKTPTEKTQDGLYKPAVNSRLFVEDIPYGLCILKSVAQLIDVKTPSIDFQIEWHQQWMGKKFIIDGKLNPELLSETGVPQQFGIVNCEQLVQASLPEGLAKASQPDSAFCSKAQAG